MTDVLRDIRTVANSTFIGDGITAISVHIKLTLLQDKVFTINYRSKQRQCLHIFLYLFIISLAILQMFLSCASAMSANVFIPY